MGTRVPRSREGLAPPSQVGCGGMQWDAAMGPCRRVSCRVACHVIKAGSAAAWGARAGFILSPPYSPGQEYQQ